MPISQLFIGLFTEGTTDIRFLESVVKRTFEEISFECSGQIEISAIQTIGKTIGLSFNESVIEASRKGVNDFGITILCIHVDADNKSDKNAFQNKFNPTLSKIESIKDDICKIIVPVIPIQMTEAWMLADKILFKKEIGTNKTDQELYIYKAPEDYSDPKATIENAIRIALQERRRRHRKELTIADLYLSMGQSISIDKLKLIPSYIKFQDNVRNALKKLNYLH
jgi:hypothetical protein